MADVIEQTRGRPPFEPTKEQQKLVATLAGYGMAHDQICMMLGEVLGEPISDKTLRKHFRQELDTGALKANAAVAASLFQTATSGTREGVTAAIFWLKTRAQWKEVVHMEHAGDKDTPLFPGVSLAELERKIVERLIAAGLSEHDARQVLLDG